VPARSEAPACHSRRTRSSRPSAQERATRSAARAHRAEASGGSAVHERALFGERLESSARRPASCLGREEFSKSSALRASASVSPPGGIALNSSRRVRRQEARGRRHRLASHVRLERGQHRCARPSPARPFRARKVRPQHSAQPSLALGHARRSPPGRARRERRVAFSGSK